MTDSNPSSGNYGFQLVHDREKAHHFSSNDHRVVKEWMKNLMKATITRDFSGTLTWPLASAEMLMIRLSSCYFVLQHSHYSVEGSPGFGAATAFTELYASHSTGRKAR